MLTILEERNVPCSELRLLASADSEGEVYKFHDDEVPVEVLGENSFAGVDIALFATAGELSARYVPIAVEAGATVVDNSSHFRLDPSIPLIVPEVNFSAIKPGHKVIANPNCSTIQLVPVLHAVNNAAGLKHIVVSTYQSVSGAGKAALDELWAQTIAVCNQQELPREAFQHQIAFNCIPQIDIISADGFTREELKIIAESRKILGLPELRITATAVRVPVFFSHAESVFIETERPFSPEDLKIALKELPEFNVYESSDEYPMQLDAAGTDYIHVGRIRRDPSVPHGLSLWIVADNVRKGAALNAVQIIEKLVAS